MFWHLARHVITLIVSDQMDTTNLSHELTIYWTKHFFFHYSSPWGIILFHLLDDIVQYDYIALVVKISINSVYFSWYLPRLKKNISFIIIPFPLTKEGRKKQQVRRVRELKWCSIVLSWILKSLRGSFFSNNFIIIDAL